MPLPVRYAAPSSEKPQFGAHARHDAVPAGARSEVPGTFAAGGALPPHHRHHHHPPPTNAFSASAWQAALANHSACAGAVLPPTVARLPEEEVFLCERRRACPEDRSRIRIRRRRGPPRLLPRNLDLAAGEHPRQSSAHMRLIMANIESTLYTRPGQPRVLPRAFHSFLGRQSNGTPLPDASHHLAMQKMSRTAALRMDTPAGGGRQALILYVRLRSSTDRSGLVRLRRSPSCD